MPIAIFTILGHWTGGIAHDMYNVDSFVYVTGQGLRILDISNLSNIEEIGYFDCGATFPVFVEEEYAYVGESFYGLRIIDVNNPLNPSQVGTYPIGSPSLIEDVIVIENIAFVCTWGSGLMILDISDKSNPVLLSSMSYEVNPAMDISIQGNYAYVACRQNGLRIVDIADPSNPNVVAFYNLGPFPDCLGVDVQGIYCYLGYDYEGFKVLNVSNPANPVHIATGWFGGSPENVDVKSEFTYVSCSDNEVLIVDISSPSNPAEIGSFITSDYVYNIRFQDYKLFVAAGNDGVYILKNDLITNINENSITISDFSISQNYPNPFNPVTKIRYEIPGQTWNDNTRVMLKVYDILGREIATLVNEEKPVGEYEVDFNAAELPSGIYFYRLKAGSYTETRKMVLLK